MVFMRNDIFSGKKIILGITGGIAAYKSCYLVRELIKRHAEVRVVMTPSAAEFISPLTFSTLTNYKVLVNTFPQSQKNGSDVSTWHIDYALWADLMIIAPATVNTIAKIAHGFADNALTTLVSALRSPLVVAPSADVDMYENKFTQENISKLESSGFYIVKAESGELASGLSGYGRMAEVNKIIDSAEIVLSGLKKDLVGKKILVTAGPTYEDIDPVRFIGNRSSGKMGYSLAKAAYLRGAEVTLVSGPTSETAYPEIKVIKVRSAADMKKSVEKELRNKEILIMSAAVADFRSSVYKSKKIKKEDKVSEIRLTRTDDILESLKKNGKTIVGFALETENEKKNAVKKLRSKNLDLIVLNSRKDKKSAFEYDTNKITVIHKNGKSKSYPLLSKFQAANKILTGIINA
jgi:phosphopantothenoylcysteine decarboxylase/phosphopantothenate--cysteine ligase